MLAAPEASADNTIDAAADIPPETRELHMVDGVRMHTRAWRGPRGESQPPVIMVHGIGIASRINRPAAEILARFRHVYAPDLPGFGKSERSDANSLEDYAEVLDHWMTVRGLSSAVVTGVSVGAQVAAAVAHRFPDRCRTLILVSPTVDASRRSWGRQAMVAPVETSMHSMRMRVVQIGDVTRAGAPLLLRTLSQALDDRIEERMPSIQQPTLVCWGTRDPMLSRVWVARVADAAPAGQLAVLPGVKHAMTHEDPLPFSRATLHFLNTNG